MALSVLPGLYIVRDTHDLHRHELHPWSPSAARPKRPAAGDLCAPATHPGCSVGSYLRVLTLIYDLPVNELEDVAHVHCNALP
jgi:hypothetical protein